MPELKLLSISDILNDKDLSKLERKLADLGVDELPDSDDSDFEDTLSDDQLTDFLDKLDAHDVACDIYLPVEFEGPVEIGERSIGSAHALLEALEELRVELDIDEETETDPDDELELEMIDEQLSHAWHVFARGASACIARSVPLLIIQ